MDINYTIAVIYIKLYCNTVVLVYSSIKKVYPKPKLNLSVFSVYVHCWFSKCFACPLLLLNYLLLLKTLSETYFRSTKTAFLSIRTAAKSCSGPENTNE